MTKNTERTERLAEARAAATGLRRYLAEKPDEHLTPPEHDLLVLDDEISRLTELHERDRGLLSQHSREGRLAIMGSEYEKKHFDDEVARLTALLAEQKATVRRVRDVADIAEQHFIQARESDRPAVLVSTLRAALDPQEPTS